MSFIGHVGSDKNLASVICCLTVELTDYLTNISACFNMNNVNGSILLSLAREDFLCMWPPLVGEVPWEHINYIKNQTSSFPTPNAISEPSVCITFVLVNYIGIDQFR